MLYTIDMSKAQDTMDEAERYHEMYWGVSPEYSQTVSVWGRKLTPIRVESILVAHGFSAEDLLRDTHDPILAGATELPESVDAAMLYAWLGY